MIEAMALMVAAAWWIGMLMLRAAAWVVTTAVRLAVAVLELLWALLTWLVVRIWARWVTWLRLRRLGPPVARTATGRKLHLVRNEAKPGSP